jgi:hypothetical protein
MGSQRWHQIVLDCISMPAWASAAMMFTTEIVRRSQSAAELENSRGWIVRRAIVVAKGQSCRMMIFNGVRRSKEQLKWQDWSFWHHPGRWCKDERCFGVGPWSESRHCRGLLPAHTSNRCPLSMGHPRLGTVSRSEQALYCVSLWCKHWTDIPRLKLAESQDLKQYSVWIAVAVASSMIPVSEMEISVG